VRHVKIRVTLSGRTYQDAAGVPEEWSVEDGAALDGVLSRLATLLADGAGLSGTCLVAVSGKHVGTISRHTALRLRDGDEVMVIAPVAGG
jgi:molybdopterin converting factor small subunit